MANKVKKCIYVIGSLRNPTIPEIGNELEKLGWEAFTDWFSAGKTADDTWQEHETRRGRDYRQALKGYHANHVFNFDLYHLNRSSAGLLVLPAGKSCHLELGYLRGQEKPVYVLFQKEPEDGRYDIMYRFATDVFFSMDEMLEGLTDPRSCGKGLKYERHKGSRSSGKDRQQTAIQGL